MAYQTGTVTGAQALVSALVTFLTANGWTVIDTLQSNADVVLKSSGSSGKFPMIIRVSTHDKTTAFNIKYLAHPSRCVPHVALRGYHTWLQPSGTPMATPTNGTFTGSTTGGTLATGTYFYRITAIGATGETLPSTEQSATIASGSTGSVTLNWNVVQGAIGYNIYGRTTGAEQKLLTVWGGGVTTWLDTGSFVPSGALPVANTAHGGVNEYGVMGESLMISPSSSSWNGYITEYRLDSANGPTLPNNPVSCVWPTCPQKTNSNVPCTHRYYGDRYGVGVAQNATNQLQFVDYATGDFFLSSGQPSGYSMNGSSWDVVYDATQDKWFVYYLSNTNFTAADAFWRYDIETGVHTRMAAGTWGFQSVDGFVLWDGQDTIYVMPGNNNATLVKYSISGNSWTTLASAPQGRSSNGFSFGSTVTMQYYVYVPASASGLSSDVIYTMLDDSDSTPLYCYNVTTNTWNDTAHGTPNITHAFGGGQAHTNQLCYNGSNYLYYFGRNINNLLYRENVQSSGLGWSNGNVFDGTSAPNNYGTAFILNHTVSRVRVHATLPTVYHFIGNSDGFTVAVNNGSLNKWYWMYGGRITSRRKSAIMTTTFSSFGPGTNLAVTVDSTANYVAGDKVYVIDASTGKQEATTIYSINSATSLSLTLVNTYTAGSFIAADPFQTVLAGDNGFACAPADPKGYKADGHAAVYFNLPMFACQGGIFGGAPSFANYMGITMSPDGMGYYQPVEGVLLQGSNVGVTLPLSKTGWYGSIPGVLFLNTLQVTGGPSAGDTIPINGHNYLFFPQQTMAIGADFKYAVVLGPIT